MKRVLQLLLIEDNPGDQRLIQELLREVERPVLKLNFATCLEDGIRFINENRVDMVLLDLSLPDSQGLESFNQIHDDRPNLPIVVLTGLDNQEVAVGSVKRGAQDYLVKGKIDGEVLRRAIQYGVERSKILQLLVEKEKKLVQSEKMASLATMLSGIAHNFNNPLFAVGAMICQLKRKGGMIDSQKKIIDQVELQLSRISGIVQNLNELTRQMVTRVDEIDLSRICQNVLKDMEHHRGDKQISHELNLKSTGIFKGNAIEIRQVMEGLLTNAIEAIEKKGIIKAKTYETEKELVLEISDNGKGIPAGVQSKIWDPFFTTKEGSAAVGLGLSIAQRIIHRHGGRIEIQSQEGVGTRASVFVPKLKD